MLHLCVLYLSRKKQWLLASSCVCLSLSTWNNSASTGRIVMKFCSWAFFWKSVEKIQVSLKCNMNSGYVTWRPMCMLHEDQCVCYMKTNVYVTWRPMCTLHEYQCVCYMKTNGYVTWRPMYVLHEDQCVCYMKTNVYVTWRPMCMLHEDQCVCYMKTNVYFYHSSLNTF